MPADTNPYGGVFGGWLMSQMALGEDDRSREIPSPLEGEGGARAEGVGG